MITTYYANFGGYFWAIGLAIATFFLMNVLKKPMLSVADLIKTTKQNRRLIHMIIGVAESVGIALALGAVANWILPFQNIPEKWFVFGGLLANYAYMLIENYKEADIRAFAKTFQNAIETSNLPADMHDISAMTDRIGDVISAFANSGSNTHKVIVDGIADKIAFALDISPEQTEKEVKNAIETLKSCGVNTESLEKELETALSDGEIKNDEKAHLLAVIKELTDIANA